MNGIKTDDDDDDDKRAVDIDDDDVDGVVVVVVDDDDNNTCSSLMLLRPRFIYCSLFSWMSVTGGRFLAPFLEHEAKFTDAQIGLCLSLQYAIASCLFPIYGHVADIREKQLPNYGRSQMLILGVTLGTICFCFHHDYCASNLLVLLGNDDNTTTTTSSSSSLSSIYHFIVQCLYAICFATMFPIIDGITLQYFVTHQIPTKDYGKERLYGAVSWGITNLLLGPLIDLFGFQVYYPCAILTCLYSVITLYIYSNSQMQYVARRRQSTAISIRGISEEEENNASEQAPLLLSSSKTTSISSSPSVDENGSSSSNRHIKQDSSIKADTKSTTTTIDSPKKQNSFTLFWIIAGSTLYGSSLCLCFFLLSTGFSVVENLVFLFFEFLGGSNTLCAVTVALTVVFEIPVFQIAPSLLEKYGVSWLMVIANVAFFIRIVGYTLVPEGMTWIVFLLEPLHGVTYAGSQSAMVEYVHTTIPKGYEASGQGLINFIRGVGGVLGLWSGGLLQDSFGPRFMYRIFATTIACGTIQFFVAAKFCNRLNTISSGGSNTTTTTTTTTTTSNSNNNNHDKNQIKKCQYQTIEEA